MGWTRVGVAIAVGGCAAIVGACTSDPAPSERAIDDLAAIWDAQEPEDQDVFCKWILDDGKAHYWYDQFGVPDLEFQDFRAFMEREC